MRPAVGDLNETTATRRRDDPQPASAPRDQFAQRWMRRSVLLISGGHAMAWGDGTA